MTVFISIVFLYCPFIYAFNIPSMIVPQVTFSGMKSTSLRKVFLLAGLAIMTTFQLSATNTSGDSVRIQYPHTLKVNLASTLFKKISLAYEYQIDDNWSVLAGGGYRFNGDIPDLAGFSRLHVEDGSNGMRGYTGTLSTRYRIRPCHCEGPAGFYAGAYVTTTYLWGKMAVTYNTGNELVDVTADASLREMGIGLQLGYQFVFWDRVTLDLMFMGPRRSHHRLDLALESQYAEQVIPIIQEEINKRLEQFGIDPLEIDRDASSKTTFGSTNFRYSISIGFMF